MANFKCYYLVALFMGLSINVAEQQSLKSLSETHHRYIGVMLSPPVFAEADFVQVLDREIDQLTPGNAMKWGSIEHTRGQPNYKDGDTIMAHAQAHGMKVRGHTLIWHSQLPEWVENGHFSATELRAIIKQHITAVAGRYKGKIYAWDVVNEILNEDGTFRQSVFYKTLGKSYVAEAFRLAHEIDPTAKLYINDYNVEGINHKSTGMYNLVKELKAEGVPIHGAGLQAHVGVGRVPHDLEANMKRFSDLGVDVAITELDVAIPKPVTAANLEVQANDYANFFRSCLAVSRCVGITMSGLTDKHDWIESFTHGKSSAPCIFDEHYKEKPAYHSVKKVLEHK